MESNLWPRNDFVEPDFEFEPFFLNFWRKMAQNMGKIPICGPKTNLDLTPLI
jgi:hypothetical protein